MDTHVVHAVARFVRGHMLFVLTVAAAGAALGLLLTRHTEFSNGLLIAASVLSSISLTIQVWHDVRAGHFSAPVLSIAAIIFAIIMRQYWAAMLIVVIATAGKVVEAEVLRRAQRELHQLVAHDPTTAHIVRKSKVSDVPASAVQPRDTIIIYPGEQVPVDATATDGTSSFDESLITGNHTSVAMRPGDHLLGGSVNTGAATTAVAAQTAARSQYQRMIRLLQAAGDHPAPFVRLADKYAIPYSIVALTTGGAAWILSRDPTRLLDVLVVTVPGALGFAPMTAMVAGMSRAARDGISIKTGATFERLARAKAAAFSKSGILTHGTLTVETVEAFSPFKQQEVLAYAAALEQSSSHPLARAILAAAERKKLKLSKTKHVLQVAARGLEGHLKGIDILVGSYQFMRDRAVVMPRDFSPVRGRQTVVYVAANGKLAGYLTCSDPVRPEAKSALAALQRFGVRQTVLVTGDHTAAGAAVAKDLSISQVIAEAAPSEKLVAIERAADHPLLFIGNGQEDAALLMIADVGIALGTRSNPTAGESADVIIMNNDLKAVIQAMARAKRSFRVATEGIVVGIGLSLILMALFATGKFPVLIGVIVQGALSTLIAVNTLRARRPARLPHVR